jgi:hypothetical protein
MRRCVSITAYRFSRGDPCEYAYGCAGGSGYVCACGYGYGYGGRCHQ